MSVIRKNNVKILGSGEQTLIFAHGYGCDQGVWEHIVPSFLEEYQIVLFDFVGSGESDLTAYNRVKYGTLHGYAEDVIEMCDALDITNAFFIGHSVGATIGALTSIKRPDLFRGIVMVAPSPSFINEEEYKGGYERQQIHQMLDSLDSGFVEWAKVVAPLIMGNLHAPELADNLFQSFCRSRPDIAKHFAQVTFLADHRTEMAKIPVPVLILQCSEDSLAPRTVGEFLQDAIPQNILTVLKATGHCPHLSAPEETTFAMKESFIKRN